MPESRVRRKLAFTPPSARSGPPAPSPRWYAVLMVTLLLLGLAWIVVYYITQTSYPIPGLATWNLIIGFGLLLVGFVMTTRWR